MGAYLEVDNIPVWQPIRLFYRAALDHRKGNADALQDMEQAIDRIMSSNLILRVPMYLGILAQAQLDRGDVGRARTTLQRATAAARDSREWWSDPELLRLSGALSYAEGDASAAEEKLQEAAHRALESGASYLALRAANDLAEIYLKRRRAAPARDVLQPVLDRFPEEFGAADMVRASRLLREAEARLV
jgi:tetratricopeptide (TPR) repeat protein